jgi:hypothetical protein
VKDDQFEALGGDPLDDPPASSGPKPKWKRHYTQVPDAWAKQLRKARHPGSAWSLAYELLYRHWQAQQDKFKQKGDPIVVSTELASTAGLSPRSVRNALHELERLGLIRVERMQRRAPRVTRLFI